MSPRPAVIAITEAGAVLARTLAAEIGDAGAGAAEVHGLRGRVASADVTFDAVATHVGALFDARRPIVGVCAAGILIRAVAPRLADKSAESPVVAVAEDASAVVPLLGGHRGAIALAEKIARALGVAPAITTAGDRRFGVALDDPPPGWKLANPADYKPFVAELLAGATVTLSGEAAWLRESALPFAGASNLSIAISDFADVPDDGATHRLVYRPPSLALGVGCERGADPRELIDLAHRALDGAGLARCAVAGVFSIDVKTDEPGVHALADALGVEARFLDAETLEAEAPRLRNPSELVFREVGCHGVAEGAALAAVGAGGALVVEKTKSARGTCAIARAPTPIDTAAIGRGRGELRVVGIGPGDADSCTPAARDAIARADHVLGYRLYLDLVAALLGGREVHAYALGEERDRVRHALSLAAGGERVALVCSGDPGIYAMASLVFEEIDAAADPTWRRALVEIVPGVSALQSAAARAGAPIGHDFCAISLSDLLTPRATIDRRLAAAIDGDFVIALYNPVSRGRRATFDRALAQLRAGRRSDTPVVVARNLGREGERVAVVSLDELDPDRVDMLTVLLVGSSQTRALSLGDGTRAWTPRGYASKDPDSRAAGGSR